MTGRYKPYSEYKDSHGEWMGLVPCGWVLMQAKFCFVLQRGHDLSSDQMVEGKYPVYGSNGPIGTHNVFTTKAPSITVGRSGSVGEINYVEIDYWAHNTSLYVKDFIGSPPRFIYYLLLAINPKRLSAGSAVGTLDRNNIHSQTVAVPSDFEKNNIANFLDYQTAKIDTLIEKQQQLIQLLKEKRQSVISHAVTKGLNPNAKMRDSGIEWLGEVPAHWEIKRLKNVLVEPVKNGLFKKKEEFGSGSLLVNVGDLYTDNYFINPETLDRVNTSNVERKQYKVESGDVFFVRSSLKLEGIGRSACFLENYDDVVFECHIVNARPDKKIMSSKYLTRYLNSLHVSQEFVSRSKTTTMTTIDQGGLTTISVLIPRIEEQVEIDNYLDRQLERLDKAENFAQDSIKLLIERRAALISAAVTGKIDVRNWVASQTEKTNKEVAA
ncbi:hypothetical protein BFW91_09020 [Pseudomonas fluorescens]|jgi:type I restriction enzyme S subunit|uniref:restriction endonuclease subunit S n=1 Tax=Pseudomonas fluorescens TaxID=294 RepID=UPI00099D923F|nr:restriction endonuclease subunit S [Pseudomonas fluorescens]OPB13541.1 hypothetical protein BFW91_09020 [Pseudomonas fluorescens]